MMEKRLSRIVGSVTVGKFIFDMISVVNKTVVTLRMNVVWNLLEPKEIVPMITPIVVYSRGCGDLI